MSTDDPLPPLPQRRPDSHKGTYGTVVIVGGCAMSATRMIGAPALAGIAALRAGAGLVKIAAPSPIIDAVLTIVPSATGRALLVGHGHDAREIVPHEAAAAIDDLLKGCGCLAIGPGLGRGEGARAAALRAVQQEDAPVVVDADALNALAELPGLGHDFRAAAVLTPHPGEFKRLCAGLGLKDDAGLARSREEAAAGLARRLACVVVLKGHRTVVSDGARTWTNDTGHPCLATAGTGDVLTGLIAGLVAQFVPPPPAVALPAAIAAKMPRPEGRPLSLFDAARVGVRLHGLAGERWAAGRGAGAGASGGLLAAELADEIPALVEAARGPDAERAG